MEMHQIGICFANLEQMNAFCMQFLYQWKSLEWEKYKIIQASW